MSPDLDVPNLNVISNHQSSKQLIHLAAGSRAPSAANPSQNRSEKYKPPNSEIELGVNILQKDVAHNPEWYFQWL